MLQRQGLDDDNNNDNNNKEDPLYSQILSPAKESILIGGDIVEQITKPKLSQLVHISWTIYCNVGIDMKINFKCIHVCNNVIAWC